MSTIEELESFERKQRSTGFGGTIKYMGQDISPRNHPTTLANYILDQIMHTVTWGVQFVAPMGFGKTSAATVVAHHIHEKRPEFLVVWGEAEDFKDLKGFLAKQPKQPLIIIFDDITGALKTMGEKEMQYNFNILTKIRWEIDPKNGKIPVITFCTYHYSKNLEKEFRAVLGTSAFCGFGNEEQTNIDSIAPKGTLARLQMERFSRIASKMFSNHEFYLQLPGGGKIRYETDNPLRPFAAISGNDGYIIVFSDKDVCAHCSKRKVLPFVEPKEVYNRIKQSYGREGILALKMALWRRGHYLALGTRAASASEFLEKRLFPSLTTDFRGLVDELYKGANRAPPKRAYTKRKINDEMLTELRAISEPIPEGVNVDEILLKDLGYDKEEEDGRNISDSNNAG